MSNYFKVGYCEDRSLVCYCYFDTMDAVAVDQISQHRIRIKHADVMKREGDGYSAFFVSIPVETENGFIEAMGELSAIMVDEGHVDYPDIAGQLAEEIKDYIKYTVEKDGWIDLPHGGKVRACEEN